MRLQVLGRGDALGSNGRFHTCFHVSTPETGFLVDRGASSRIAVRRHGADPNGLIAAGDGMGMVIEF